MKNKKNHSNTKIKKDNYILKVGSKIKAAIILFQRNRSNFTVVLDKNKNFLGVLTFSDIKKALISGNTINSKIDKFINRKPAFIKGEVNQINISNLITTKKFLKAEPPLIPIINKSNKLVKIINKDYLKIFDLKRLKKEQSVLLIGGAGYIGTVLAKNLINSGYHVTIFDKFIYLNKNEVKKQIKSNKIKLIKGDTRDISQIFKAIKNCDMVVHLAEMVGDPLCEQKPDKTFEINFLASISIANICKNLEISKFVYLSSCSVYGENKDDKLLTENSRINPLSTYAKLKDLCEKSIIKNLGNNCQPCIVRLGTVYGNSMRPRYDLVINLFCGLIANNKKITINGGNQWRPFVHVEDAAKAITKILKLNQSKVNGQVFNIVGENFKIKQIGKIISNKYPKAQIEYKKKAKDLRDYKVGAKKAEKILSFRPLKKISNEIIPMIRETKKRKIKNIFSRKYINVYNLNRFLK